PAAAGGAETHLRGDRYGHAQPGSAARHGPHPRSYEPTAAASVGRLICRISVFGLGMRKSLARTRDARLAIPGFAPAAWVRAPRCTELTVPGDRGFESGPLQRRVRKPSAPR